MRKILPLPLFAALALFSVLSCSKNEISLAEFEDVEAVSFGSLQTKTHLEQTSFSSAGVVKLTWDKGDRVGAFGEVTSNSLFEATSVNSAEVGFSGAQARGDVLRYAYYPYVDGANDPYAVPVSISSNQSPSAISSADIRATNSITKSGDRYAFNLGFVTSFIKVNLDLGELPALTDGEAILSYSISSERPLTGSYHLNLSDLKLTSVAGATEVEVKLDGNQKVSDGPVKSLVSVAPTLKRGDVVTISVETTRHDISAKFVCQDDFEPGVAYSFNLKFSEATTSGNELKIVSKEGSYSVPDLAELTLAQKVGQMFFVRPENLSSTSKTAYSASLLTEFNKYPVGGVCLFKDNILNPSQIVAFNKAIHGLPIYPIITVDEEGGRVARIASNSNFSVPKYSSMLAVGNTGDVAAAYEAGKAIGSYLREYGFDLDFAPVADVFTNPANTVIGDRAFSTDPNVAAAMMTSFLYGLRSNAVEGCLKHFPGHGDTATDSHTGYAEAPKTWAQMQTCEMIPFKEGIANGARMIMSAHVTCPKVTSDGRPSSLSYEMITGKLKGELGYNGLVITDGMGMAAVTKQFPDCGNAAIEAIKAGADIVLLPPTLSTAYNAVLNAVKNGDISESRINQSVEKILQLKRDILRGRGELAE